MAFLLQPQDIEVIKEVGSDDVSDEEMEQLYNWSKKNGDRSRYELGGD